MEKIKKYLKPTVMWILFVVLYIVILSILNYLNVTKLNMVVKINFAAVAIITLLFGISSGKKTSKKGYLEGLKLGAFIIILLFLLNLIFFRKFNLQILLYYLVIIASSTIGSMIGINLKR